LDDLVYSPLVEMAANIRSRRISPVELTEAHLKRIACLNPKLNAYVYVDAEGARQQAMAAEAALASRVGSDSLGPLHGVPLSMKSSVDVAGWPCECGSALRKGYVPTEDAPLVARLRAAGAILLGNTNCPEFLMAYETDNCLYGRTNNPWDLSRTPGGSSGGEAAAIAAGCSAGGVGSDGGGSIRVPAHYVGICGLKPTPGRVPGTGHYPTSAGPFAQLGVVGPMARTIADVTRLFEVMAGPDPGDPASAPVPLRRWREQEVRKLRIAYFEDDGTTPVTPETAAAVRQAAKALRDQGFEVESWCPQNLDRVSQLWWNLFGPGVQMAFTPTIDGREDELSPMLRAWRASVMKRPPLDGRDWLSTLLGRDALREKLLRQMEHFPILLCPVCAVPAFHHGQREWTVQGQRVKYLKAMSYSQWLNLLGFPGAVVPIGRSPEGLPIGVQVVGRAWEDEAVLAVAAKIEAATGGFRRPPISRRVPSASLRCSRAQSAKLRAHRK
jgi:Asp-tRNA(Asn)/Glu-tRNA(Gln) amidotransferase A subunit family amidase